MSAKLNPDRIRELCRIALAEDVGPGDATTLAVVPAEMKAKASFRTRKDCVPAGLPVVAQLFEELGGNVVFTPLVKDGDFCPAGTVLATVEGRAQTILTAERVALNILQHLSGVATMTHAYVQALRSTAPETKTVILDTRKTIPGLRELEKYAVACGGGTNHRMGLYDMIMIKDNHRALAALTGPDSIRHAVERCRKAYPQLKVEVEADSLDDVRRAVEAGADIVMFDNMSNEQMVEALKMTAGRCKTEASGNITIERLPSMGKLGLDFISSGALTHSVKAVDIGLDM